MAIINTISFPEPDGVTGLPKLDGWTGETDPGTTKISFAEAGYSTGGRVTYAGGSKFPPVAFQCIRATLGAGAPVAAGSYLIFGLFCSFDPTYDEQDGITLAFLPDFGTKTHTTARRIDLLPNLANLGAGAAGGGLNGTSWDWEPFESNPASAPNPSNPGDHPTYFTRIDRQLPGIFFWQGIGANPPPPTGGDATARWQTIAVNNVHARAAAWRPATVATDPDPTTPPIPTTGTSQSPPFTLKVVDVQQFPSAGNLQVFVENSSVPLTVSYTGRDIPNKTFTGCIVPKATTGGPVEKSKKVTLLDVGWSVEVAVPTTMALGGNSWIDLTGRFGLYVNLFRWSTWLPQPGTPVHAGKYAAQYRFPIPDPNASIEDQHFMVGFLNDNDYIGPDWYGRATIPQITGTNDALGVGFQDVGDPLASVGVRHPGSAVLTGTIDGNLENVLVAQIQNTDPANAANDVTAEFRFAKAGIPSTDFGEWDPASAHGASNPTRINLTPAGTANAKSEVTSTWLGQNVPSDYAFSIHWPGHHCIWVRLNSGTNVNFFQGGVRDNMEFINLSEFDSRRTISGRGYAPPESGSHHDFVLFSHVRNVSRVVDEDEFPEGRRGPGEQQLWHWTVHAFRRTGLTFSVGGETAEVLDPSPGQFGLIAQHDGAANDVFVHQLSGGGIERIGNGYELRVPHNGEVTIDIWAGAGPEGQVRPPKPAPWWLRFIRWLIALIKRILHL